MKSTNEMTVSLLENYLLTLDQAGRWMEKKWRTLTSVGVKQQPIDLRSS